MDTKEGDEQGSQDSSSGSSSQEDDDSKRGVPPPEAIPAYLVTLFKESREQWSDGDRQLQLLADVLKLGGKRFRGKWHLAKHFGECGGWELLARMLKQHGAQREIFMSVCAITTSLMTVYDSSALQLHGKMLCVALRDAFGRHLNDLTAVKEALAAFEAVAANASNDDRILQLLGELSLCDYVSQVLSHGGFASWEILTQALLLMGQLTRLRNNELRFRQQRAIEIATATVTKHPDFSNAVSLCQAYCFAVARLRWQDQNLYNDQRLRIEVCTTVLDILTHHPLKEEEICRLGLYALYCVASNSFCAGAWLKQDGAAVEIAWETLNSAPLSRQDNGGMRSSARRLLEALPRAEDIRGYRKQLRKDVRIEEGEDEEGETEGETTDDAEDLC